VDEINIRFVTSNPMKVAEVQSFFEDTKIRITHLNLSYPELQTNDYQVLMNHAFEDLEPRVSGNILIDDTVLRIPRWNDFPGFYTKDVLHRLGRDGILRLMRDETDRRAEFITFLGLRFQNERYIFEGRYEGTLTTIDWTPAGHGRIYRGFDGIIAHEGQSFIQLSPSEKNQWSHRGAALRKLQSFLSSR